MAELGKAANEQLAAAGRRGVRRPAAGPRLGGAGARRLNGPWLGPDLYTGCDLTPDMDGKAPAT
jgi:hypothetical protein